jgi:hypothetical protein
MRRSLVPAVIVPSAFGALLRLYELLALEGVPLQALRPHPHLWSLLPYAVAVVLSLYPRLKLGAVGFASACLVADLLAHFMLFYGPRTDSLLVLFLPLWNLLVIGPAGAILALLYARWRPGAA